ncbi:alpha-1,3/alpha-1,6-mannosyltransferase [Sarotherodon galilaeus]
MKATWTRLRKIPHPIPTGFDRVNYWHSLDMAYTCLTPVVGLTTITPRQRPPPRLRSGGVNPQNLRPIGRAPTSAAEPPVPLRLSLVNARSLANKTFILKDFFTDRELDLMLLTETWQRVDSLDPFLCSLRGFLVVSDWRVAGSEQ